MKIEIVFCVKWGFLKFGNCVKWRYFFLQSSTNALLGRIKKNPLQALCQQGNRKESRIMPKSWHVSCFNRTMAHILLSNKKCHNLKWHGH